MLSRFALLAAAGALGTLCRYAVSAWIARVTAGGFPWETCAVNLAGCFAIGALAAYADRAGLAPATRAVLTVGLVGGFTTFSTFGLETFRMLERADWVGAAAYIGLSNLGGLAAVLLGHRALQLLG